MNVLTAVLFVVAHASLASCRTRSASHDASEPEVALVSPRKVPTLAQLIPILEGPDLPEVKLRKLRKLIPIYDDLTRWRIDHNERLVELLPYKNKAKPLAYILAGKDYMQHKKPDIEENNAKNYNNEHKLDKIDSDESTVNPKFDVNHRKGYKSYNERPHTKSTESHTKSEYSRNSFKEENDKKYNRIHSSDFSHNNENKKHKNNDNYKSEFNSNEPESESNESSNENTESSRVTGSSEKKSINDKKKSKEKTRENEEKSDRKEHESQKSHTKRPYKKSYKHSYKGKDDKKHNSREHSSERHHKENYANNKNIYSTNSGSYSKSESNEDNESWSKDTESSSEDSESKSTENESIEDKIESVEKTSHIHSNSNKSRQLERLETLNKFSIDDSAAQEASISATEGLLSTRPYFISHSNISSVNSHSTHPDSLSNSNERDSMSSKYEDNSLTANSDSKVNVISSEIRTVPESEKYSENVSIVHAVSLESNVPDDSTLEFKADDVATRNHLSESMSESVSDESISNTEFNESKSKADSGKGSEVDSKTTESDKTKELPNAHFRSIFPIESPSYKETIESVSDINSKSVSEFNISDLESNQSESSVKSTESQSESDSNYIPEATSDAELVVSALKSNTFESVSDENSSKSASVSNEYIDSSGSEFTSHAESASESVSDVKSTSVADENSKYESEESVSDVSKVSEFLSDSNSSGLDSISEFESVPNGVYDVKSNEYDYVSNDGNESTSDLESKKYSNEEKNKSTSTNSDESKFDIADFTDSGLTSNSGFELTDFYKPYGNVETESQYGGIMKVGKALISDENDVGDLDVMTEKSYEKLSHESRFDNDDEMMIENRFGGFTSDNDVVNEESTKHNKDGHHVKAHVKHVSDDNSSFDVKSADTSHDALYKYNDKHKQDSTMKAEKEDLVEVITGNENAITKNILIKYDTSRENDIIIDARTYKEQENDLNNNENHRDVAIHNHRDMNTDAKQNNNTNELGTNENVKCDTPNNKMSVAPKGKHQHKTYKLSFIFN